MNEVSSSSEQFTHFNYESCIVNRHEDSSDSSLSNFSLRMEESDFRSDKIENDHFIMDLTSEQVEDFDFNPEDSFVFLLGILNTIEKYLKKMDQGSHTKWLQKQILILKIVLIRRCDLFRIHEVKDVNGSVYIKSFDSDEKAMTEEKKQPIENHSDDEPRPQLQLNAENHTIEAEANVIEINTSLSEAGVDDWEPNHTRLKSDNSLKVNHKNSKGFAAKSKVNCRQSERLQNIPRVKKFNCWDKLASVVSKLEPYQTSTPLQMVNKTSDKTKKVKSRLVRNILSKSASEVKNVKTESKRRGTSLGIQSTKKENTKDIPGTNKITAGRKTKSLGTNLKTKGLDSVSKEKDDVKIRTKKKRSASSDAEGSRKAKKLADHSLDEASVSTLSNISCSKRKLYSQDSWLHTLHSISLAELSNT